jgi:CDP-glucose 4,6-dehydratase
VPVVGLSLPAQPFSLYERAGRQGAIPEEFFDIRDFESVSKFMSTYKPSAIIHMAAQPLVFDSYKNPRYTFETNVMGTVNILDSAFATSGVEGIVVVTTDKVYRNDNSGLKFKESDALAGKDPYSASKVGTESAVAAWQHISKVIGGPKVVAVRAGNVIGGGDWAEHRLMPDLIRGFAGNSSIAVRNPLSTRPWQHVLDPLRGYLQALESTLGGGFAPAFNFGPDSKSLSVKEVVEISRQAWPSSTSIEFSDGLLDEGAEAVELHLDSSTSRQILSWRPCWSQEESVIATIKWWDRVMNGLTEPVDACASDIDFMMEN